MDRVFTFLLTIGISSAVVNWLRARPLVIIVLLGLLAWAPVIFVVWLFMQLLG